MKRFLRRGREDRLPDAAAVREIDERHHIAQQVFFRREERGWSQRNLADLAALTPAQIALVEAGHANPPLRALVRLAHALGCSLAELTAPRETQPATAPPAADQEGTRLLTG